MKKEAMRMERVTYMSQGMKLLDNFNFQVFQGEIMGLLPIDSIGLEAFIDLAQYNHPIFYGYVYINEILVNSCLADVHTVNDVYYISHDSNLVDTLSAWDNVFTLRRGYRGVYLKNKVLIQQLNLLIQELNIDMDITMSLEKMTIFEKYLLDIIKGVLSKASVIIIRSLGSLVNEWDLQKLMKVVSYYKTKGFSFVFITADWEEIERYCDRASVMAEGFIKRTLSRKDFDKDYIQHLRHLQVQHDMHLVDKELDSALSVCEFILVSFKNIHKLSFSVKQGECFVLADNSNKIQKDIEELILGKKPQDGIILWGIEKAHNSERRSVAVVLENPLDTMLYPEMTYAENIGINIDHKITRIWRNKTLRYNIVREMDIEDKIDPDILVKHLSLHQKYELIYKAIWLQNPDVVFCINPFLNVDVDLMYTIQKWIQRLLQKGIAVIIITVNYQNMLPIADKLMLIEEKGDNIIFNKEELQELIGS